jgi:hypothetical protein
MKQQSLLLALCVLGCVCLAQTPNQTPPIGAYVPPPKPPPTAPKDAKLSRGKWYAVIYEKVAWPVAREKCERMGGQLVVIHDPTTWAFVQKLTNQRVWLGATDENLEGEWVWVDGKKMTFTAWSPGNPSNSNAKEHYLSTTDTRLWNDTGKEWEHYKQDPVVGYICEWPLR